MKELFPELILDEIYVIGGGSKDDLWNQIKSDILGLKYLKLKSFENTLKGCYVIAAYGSKIENDIEKITKKIKENQIEKIYNPNLNNNKIYNNYYNIYKDIFKKNLINIFHEIAKERGN